MLVLALAALLIAGASADRALLANSGADKAVKSGKGYGKGYKSYAKACAKTFAGCASCTGTVADGDFACDACVDINASTDGGACVCNEDYGTVTKRQMKAYYKANKGAKGKHYAKYAKCFLCSDFDLVSVDGVCTLLL